MAWHYLSYFEDGREAFGRMYGLSYLDIRKKGFNIPLVKSEVDYKHPLKYGDCAVIKVTFINTAAAKLIFKFTITNQDDILICIAETTQVFTDMTGKLILLTPSFLNDWKIQVGIED